MTFAIIFKREISQKRLNVSQLAKKSGLPHSTLASILDKKTCPSFDKAVKIATALGVSLDYFASDKEVKTAKTTTKDTVAVPFYGNMPVSAGSDVAMNEGITDYLPFNKLWLEQKIGISKGLTAFPITGDSMHPTYRAEDTVICAVTNGDFNGDAIYIINLDGDVMIKRLAKLPQGRLHIISDNVKYPNFEINLTDENINLKIIALVKMAVVLN